MAKNRKVLQQNFVDYVKVHVESGNGGRGSTHLRREKFIPKGGPDGGDGGRGGHVIIKANDQKWTLLHLKYQRHFKAGHGGDGGKQQSTGKDGKDVYIEVPLGTVLRDAESNAVIKEMTELGEEFVVMRGGKGGLGNSNFKTAVNQTPRYAQPGQDGRENWIVIELKLLADVGLVGFPNAGKSTLLSVISAAKPEIGAYPFTTLVPNLGMVSYRNDRSFVMADIPGIIEGASEGKGLGYRFLRHIERNSVLLFMIPCDTDDLNREFDILYKELEKFNPELLDKEFVVAITKSDFLDDTLKKELEETITFKQPYVFISSVAQKGLTELKDLLWKAINEEV